MRITDIHVDGFGVWNAMSVDDLSERITVFYGPNEAGKTTLMQYLRAVLYGFSPERRRIYLPPIHGGEAGGLLRVRNHSGEYVIERRVPESDPESPGRVVVLASGGSRQGQHLLNMLTSGIDETIFNNVFAVGIRELQELATLNETQAAEQLYNLASGVDRVSLVEVMRELQDSRKRIWSPGQADGELAKLQLERDKLQEEIGELESQTRRWVDLAGQRRAVAGEVADAEARISGLKFDVRKVEIAVQARETWCARADIQRQLERIGRLEPLPDDALERLDGLNEQIASQRTALEPAKKSRLEIRRRLAAQPINQALWNQGSRIEAICEHGPWLASLDDEIKRLGAQVESCEMELLQHEEVLLSEGLPVSGSVVVSEKTQQQLQGPAQSLREALKKREIARKLQKKSRQVAHEASSELEQELEGRSVEDFDEALEDAGLLVKRLRRRIQQEEQLEQLERRRDDLADEHQRLLDEQLQRVRILVGIGGMFVFGFVLTLTGLFGWNFMPMSAEISWGLGALGLICVGLSAAWKSLLERTSQDELNQCLRQRESLEDDIELLCDQRDDLERELPPGRGTWAGRLVEAERALRDLEEMAPLQQERQKASRRKQESRKHGSGAGEELREARSRWRRALRHLGLPETLTPKQVRRLAAHHQTKEKLERRLREHRTRLEDLQRDRGTLVERLAQLNEDVGLRTVSSDPQIQLSQLATALAGQREMVEQRRAWQREEKELRRELSRGLQQLRRLARGREAIFAEARVTDEEALRARAEAVARRDALQSRLATLSRQIAALVGDHCEEPVIGQLIDEHDEGSLRQRQQQLRTRLQDAQAHLAQLHQRRGEVHQEMKLLSENRRLAEARFRLAAVETRMLDAARRWRSLAVTLSLLEQIRETYEAERQPETLGEASLYLAQLTSGKYARIWTPLGKNELRVDDQQGHAMPLDVLSRGTREAVFLSLRLALVAAYGRRGVNLPLVLDDVLVNLDAVRSEAAVRVLCDFAHEGRQILFFTCHEHIKAMFLRAGVDTRMLPKHGTPGVHVVPLLTQDVAESDAEADRELDDEEAVWEAEEPAVHAGDEDSVSLDADAEEEDEEAAEAYEVEADGSDDEDAEEAAEYDDESEYDESEYAEACEACEDEVEDEVEAAEEEEVVAGDESEWDEDEAEWAEAESEDESEVVAEDSEDGSGRETLDVDTLIAGIRDAMRREAATRTPQSRVLHSAEKAAAPHFDVMRLADDADRAEIDPRTTTPPSSMPVHGDLGDEGAFDDGPWWWDSSRTTDRSRHQRAGRE